MTTGHYVGLFNLRHVMASVGKKGCRRPSLTKDQREKYVLPKPGIEPLTSRQVSHPSPDRAQHCLTSVISFMFMLSMCYRGGRNCSFSHKATSYIV